MLASGRRRSLLSLSSPRRREYKGLGAQLSDLAEIEKHLMGFSLGYVCIRAGNRLKYIYIVYMCLVTQSKCIWLNRIRLGIKLKINVYQSVSNKKSILR